MNSVEAGAFALGPAERRALGDLRLLDIGDGRGGRQFGAAEAAETVERRHAEIARDAAFRRRAVEQHAGCGLATRPSTSKTGFRSGSWNSVSGDDQFARIDAQDIGSSRSALGLGDRRKTPVEISIQASAIGRSAAAADARERHQVVAVEGESSFSSVIVPGVTRRTTSRRTTDFEPRFFASAGSSICSQTATRKPKPISFCR
jgi:hypothetical protein